MASLFVAPLGKEEFAAASPEIITRKEVYREMNRIQKLPFPHLTPEEHDPNVLLAAIGEAHRDREFLRVGKVEWADPGSGGCLPWAGVRDFAGAYWQVGVDDPGLCGLQAWDPTASPPRWELFQSAVLSIDHT